MDLRSVVADDDYAVVADIAILTEPSSVTAAVGAVVIAAVSVDDIAVILTDVAAMLTLAKQNILL